MKLENWSVVNGGSPFSAPENRPARLAGEIYGDTRGRWADGERITTSAIVGVDGRSVTTHSGSTYELGEAAPEYVEYVRSQGRELDPVQPIKIKRSEEVGRPPQDLPSKES